MCEKHPGLRCAPELWADHQKATNRLQSIRDADRETARRQENAAKQQERIEAGLEPDPELELHPDAEPVPTFTDHQRAVAQVTYDKHDQSLSLLALRRHESAKANIAKVNAAIAERRKNLLPDDEGWRANKDELEELAAHHAVLDRYAELQEEKRTEAENAQARIDEVNAKIATRKKTLLPNDEGWRANERELAVLAENHAIVEAHEAQMEELKKEREAAEKEHHTLEANEAIVGRYDQLMEDKDSEDEERKARVEALEREAALAAHTGLYLRDKKTAPVGTNLPPRNEDIVAMYDYIEWKSGAGHVSGKRADPLTPEEEERRAEAAALLASGEEFSSPAAQAAWERKHKAEKDLGGSVPLLNGSGSTTIVTRTIGGKALTENSVSRKATQENAEAVAARKAEEATARKTALAQLRVTTGKGTKADHDLLATRKAEKEAISKLARAEQRIREGKGTQADQNAVAAAYNKPVVVAPQKHTAEQQMVRKFAIAEQRIREGKPTQADLDLVAAVKNKRPAVLPEKPTNLTRPVLPSEQRAVAAPAPAPTLTLSNGRTLSEADVSRSPAKTNQPAQTAPSRLPAPPAVTAPKAAPAQVPAGGQPASAPAATSLVGEELTRVEKAAALKAQRQQTAQQTGQPSPAAQPAGNTPAATPSPKAPGSPYTEAQLAAVEEAKRARAVRDAEYEAATPRPRRSLLDRLLGR